jgi:hypothetical protein
MSHWSCLVDWAHRNLLASNLHLPLSAKSRRTLSLPQTAIEALKEHHRRQTEDRLAAGALWQEIGLVFVSTIGTPLDASNVRREFRPRVSRGLARGHSLSHRRRLGGVCGSPACSRPCTAESGVVHQLSPVCVHAPLVISPLVGSTVNEQANCCVLPVAVSTADRLNDTASPDTEFSVRVSAPASA